MHQAQRPQRLDKLPRTKNSLYCVYIIGLLYVLASFQCQYTTYASFANITMTHENGHPYNLQCSFCENLNDHFSH